MAVGLVVNGTPVTVEDDAASLLDALRDELGERSAKDGCSPQGQCGCCTVLVDGAPRVACVTPVRRVAGREVTTLEGLAEADRWAETFTAFGASQCGFCTPGIIVRLAARARRGALDAAAVEDALVAHLCRCTGWRTIIDAAVAASGATPVAARPAPPGAERSARRAEIEGRSPQRVGPQTARGAGGFADDTAPRGSLVAVPSADGDWVVGATVRQARAAAGKVQGRRSGVGITWPVDVPPGEWDLTLQTTWVEPAYLEPDASWCAPGGAPATPLANGGAFGGKTASPVPAAAADLAARHGRVVRALWSREDVVRWGPKRPPLAAGIRADGSGIVRVARTAGVAAAVASVAPGLHVEEVDVPGPPTSADLRASGWAEAAVLLAALHPDPPVTVVAPWGAWATARVDAGGVHVRVGCGDPLDEVVLRSYCVGAAHQAFGWVTNEGLAVSADGTVHDLTIRSFGVLRAADTPPIDVDIAPPGEPPPARPAQPAAPGTGRPPGPPVDPVNGSDVVFAAVAAATWVWKGRPPKWPTDRKGA